jgi:hypothetical protein
MASSMYETIVNSLSAHVAVLNNKGLIIETNRAWAICRRKRDAGCC